MQVSTFDWARSGKPDQKIEQGESNMTIEDKLDDIIDEQILTLMKVDLVRGDIQKFKQEYQRDKAAAEAAGATQEVKDAFKARQMALAEGLPALTKGTLAAVDVFSRTPVDPIAGSAAIMDICSTLASTLGALSTAGGPPGMLLGALFSMVSMILNFFLPKQPDLMERIEKLMRGLEAERNKSKIEAASDAVTTYSNVCDQFMKPASNGDVQDPRLLSDETKKFNLVEGNSMQAVRETQKWLEVAENQELDGWPEVLNLQCEVYVQLWLAITRQILYAHDAEKIKKYVGHPEDPQKLKDWAKLQRKVYEEQVELTINDGLVSKFLKKIVPVARKRGIYAIAYSGGWSYATSGPKAFRENKFEQLWQHCRRMSITEPREGVNSPGAQYDIWVLDTWNEQLGHGHLDTRTRKLTGAGDTLGGGEVFKQFLDWWPVPVGGDPDKLAFYGTRDWAQGGAIDRWEWNQNAKTFVNSGWRLLTNRLVSQVRLVSSPATLPDDPDKAEMPEKLSKGVSVIYGTLKDSTDIFVAFDDANGWGDHRTVPIPMGAYTGIAVDRHFLWMYGPDGFACATHASVMSCCISKKRSMPLWLGNGNPDNIRGALDLSSCADGTLLVSTPTSLSTAVYHIDFKAPRGEGMGLTYDTWESFQGGGGATQVQKLPIYGWQQLERLHATVNKGTGFRPQ